jgi:hypothetical protein
VDTIKYTVTNGCGTAAAAYEVTVKPLPAPIEGTGAMCQASIVTLNDADTGGTWRSSSMLVALIIPSTTTMIGLLPGTATISYTVGGCTTTSMVTVNPVPPSHTVTGGGSFCPPDAGVLVGLNGSDNGITYMLLQNGFPSGSIVPGTGSTVDFGLQNVAGTYSVTAVNPTTGCLRIMTGTATVSPDTLYNPLVTVTATPGLNIAAGQSVTLHAVVTDGGPTPHYQWVVNGTYIGGATSANYTSAAFANRDSIACFVTSSSQCGTRTSLQSVIMHVRNVGIGSLSASDALRIYPNPASKRLNISLTDDVYSQASVTLTNLLGEKVREFPIETNRENGMQLDVAPGIYLVIVTAGDNRYMTKLMIR